MPESSRKEATPWYGRINVGAISDEAWMRILDAVRRRLGVTGAAGGL